MHILITMDGSPESLHALDYIRGQADLLGQNPEVTILNVQDPLPARIAAALEEPSKVHKYYQEEANKVFDKAKERLGSVDYVKYIFRVGEVAETIVREAHELKADLVIMGNHGHGALGALLFGSVSNEVLSKLKVPALMLREILPLDPHGLRVGIAVDGSEYSDRAVEYVLNHRELFGPQPRFTLINVATDFSSIVMPSLAGVPIRTMNKREISEIQAESHEKALAPLVPRFEAAGVQVRVAKLIGNPGDAITKYCRTERLDLLVIGSHGYDRLDAVLLGSVATRVAATSEIPLLIVH